MIYSNSQSTNVIQKDNYLLFIPVKTILYYLNHIFKNSFEASTFNQSKVRELLSTVNFWFL